jgi:flagellar basal-body rod modification protein FlgD
MSSTAPVTNDPFAALHASANGTVQTKNDAAAADRFLKLLVTQMQNQDPLNPMDNAQVTSQMAQINTVSGIEKLNTTVEGLNGQFLQMQALQGAALVGRAVTLQGSQMHLDGGAGVAGFELAGTADNVKVEVLNPAGRVLDTINLGTLAGGRHGFAWQAPATANVAADASVQFRVVAKSGTAAVPTTPLMRDTVTSVSTQGSTLTLQTRHSGDVAYAAVKAFN